MKNKLVLIAVFTAGFWVVPDVALAADSQVVVDTTVNQVQVLSMLIGVVLPIIVGLVTKTVTANGTRAILLAALSAVTAFITEAVNVGGFGDSFDWMAAALTALMTFVVAVATHFGLWVPTGVANKAVTSGRR